MADYFTLSTVKPGYLSLYNILQVWNNVEHHSLPSLVPVTILIPYLLFFYQIRVNAVNPTAVMTDIGKLGWADPAKAKVMLDKIPLGRFSGTTTMKLI